MRITHRPATPTAFVQTEQPVNAAPNAREPSAPDLPRQSFAAGRPKQPGAGLLHWLQHSAATRGVLLGAAVGAGALTMVGHVAEAAPARAPDAARRIEPGGAAIHVRGGRIVPPEGSRPAGTTTPARILGVNAAPTIEGTPITTARVGAPYVFQPVAADADHDALTFSIQNKPAWASFSTATGKLSGTPMAGNEGLANNIVISVNDGTVTRALPAFAIDVAPAAARTTLAWTPPTMNSDGTPLTNLAGYEILHSMAPDTDPTDNQDSAILINDPAATTYVIESLQPGTHYFTIKSVATTGAKSDPSNIASKTIGPPGAPTHPSVNGN